jgi:hypothetical protein
MIKRILNPDDINLIAEDIFPVMEEKYQWYMDFSDISTNKESIISHLRESVHSSNTVIFSNKGKEKYNAVGIFNIQKDPIVDKLFLSEVMLWSDEPRVGFKIFKEACKLGKNLGCEFITMGSRESNPHKDRFEKILILKGLTKEASTFYMKL